MLVRASEIMREALGHYKPRPYMAPHEWASQNIYIPAGQSINAGFYDPAFMPFQNEILDSIADPKIKQVIFVASAQIGKTNTITVMMAYIVANDPAPILYTRGTDSEVKTYVKNDFNNIFDNCKALDGVFAANKGKESSNTLNDKKYHGGFVRFAGAQSPNRLSGFAVKYYFGDEIGKYRAIPVFGHPLDLASSRTKTWEAHGAKKVYISTPTVAGLKGDIYTMYENLSDMRVFQVPCPKCGFFQELQWDNVKFNHCKQKDGSYDLTGKVFYECCNPACMHRLNDSHRIAAVKRGHWVKINTEPERQSVAGFKISQLYSPLTSLENIAREWLEKKDDPISRQQFKNETLGLPYDEDVSIKTSAEALYRKREVYRAQVPMGVGYISMAIDTQGTPRDEGTSPSYLEYTVVGWGLNWECWVIEHGIVDGSPANPQTWATLESIINQVYQHESGSPITISKVGIDTQGGWTQQVLDWVKGKGPRILGIYGAKTHGAPLLPKRFTESGHKKVRTWGFGTTNAKNLIYGHILGNNLIHFPMSLDEEYFRQLFAEKPEEKVISGSRVTVYKQIRQRNEALDLLVYNVGLMAMSNRKNELADRVKSFTVKMDEPEALEDQDGLETDGLEDESNQVPSPEIVTQVKETPIKRPQPRPKPVNRPKNNWALGKIKW